MYVCPSGRWNVPHRREGERSGTHPATSSMAPGKPKGTLSCWLSWVDIRLGTESQCRVSQGSWALPGEGESRYSAGPGHRGQGAGQAPARLTFPGRWARREAAFPVRRLSPRKLGTHTPSLQEESSLSSSVALISAVESCLQLSEL